MGDRLAGRLRSVMAGAAGAGDTVMIKVHIGPTDADMTIVTGIAGSNMVGGFPPRRGAVVTTAAGTHDGGVVHPHTRRPGVDAMAV